MIFFILLDFCCHLADLLRDSFLGSAMFEQTGRCMQFGNAHCAVA